MSANIFISFAGQDLKVAFTLCKALESRGFKCWISSRDILPGENFQVAIVRAIRTAKMMLLVFTGNSNNSEEMTKELALASQHKLIVIPLRIEDVVANDAFAYEFATRQWIDFFADWEAAINQLSERIAQAIPEEIPPGLEPVVAAAAVAAPVAPQPPAPVVATPTPPAAPEPAKELTVATMERPAAAGAAAAAAVALKQADAKPVAPDPAKAKQAAAPVAPVGKLPPARTNLPPAKRPDAAAAGDEPAKKSRMGLFVAIGVVILLLIVAGIFVPSLLAPKPPAAKPAAVAVAHPAATPSVTPPAVAIVTPSATPASNTLAAGASNALVPDPNAPKPHKHPHAAAAAEHHESEVPF